MKKNIVLIFLIVFGAYFLISSEIPLKTYFSDAVNRLKSLELSNIFDYFIDEYEVDSRHADYLTDEQQPTQQRIEAISPPAEREMPVTLSEARPRLKLQGVIRENGDFSAIINNEIYRVNEFIDDNRIVHIASDYIILQGRTRRFRYNIE